MLTAALLPHLLAAADDDLFGLAMVGLLVVVFVVIIVAAVVHSAAQKKKVFAPDEKLGQWRYEPMEWGVVLDRARKDFRNAIILAAVISSVIVAVPVAIVMFDGGAEDAVLLFWIFGGLGALVTGLIVFSAAGQLNKVQNGQPVAEFFQRGFRLGGREHFWGSGGPRLDLVELADKDGHLQIHVRTSVQTKNGRTSTDHYVLIPGDEAELAAGVVARWQEDVFASVNAAAQLRAMLDQLRGKKG